MAFGLCFPVPTSGCLTFAEYALCGRRLTCSLTCAAVGISLLCDNVTPLADVLKPRSLPGGASLCKAGAERPRATSCQVCLPGKGLDFFTGTTSSLITILPVVGTSFDLAAPWFTYVLRCAGDECGRRLTFPSTSTDTDCRARCNRCTCCSILCVTCFLTFAGALDTRDVRRRLNGVAMLVDLSRRQLNDVPGTSGLISLFTHEPRANFCARIYERGLGIGGEPAKLLSVPKDSGRSGGKA